MDGVDLALDQAERDRAAPPFVAGWSLIDQTDGFEVDNDMRDNPILVGPNGHPVTTWKRNYPYQERMIRRDYEIGGIVRFNQPPDSTYAPGHWLAQLPAMQLNSPVWSSRRPIPCGTKRS